MSLLFKRFSLLTSGSGLVSLVRHSYLQPENRSNRTFFSALPQTTHLRVFFRRIGRAGNRFHSDHQLLNGGVYCVGCRQQLCPQLGSLTSAEKRLSEGVFGAEIAREVSF